MLVKWSVGGFKSIYNQEEFELAPLTLFTGANSSGKSTIIQSILVTAQTFQNPIKNNKVLLNGPLIRLGSFEDILSDGLKGKTTLGFSVDLDGIYSERLQDFHENDEFSQPTYYDEDEYEYYADGYEEDRPLEIHFTFASNPEEAESKYYPPVTKLEVIDYDVPTYDSYTKTVIERSLKGIEEKKKRYQIKYSEKNLDSILQHEVTGTEFFEDEEAESAVSKSIIGAQAKGFLDMEYFSLENLNHVIANLIMDYYSMHPETPTKFLNKIIEKQETREIYKEILKVFINEIYRAELLSVDSYNVEMINDYLDYRSSDLEGLLESLDLIQNVIAYGHRGMPLQHSIDQGFRKNFLEFIDARFPLYTQVVPKERAFEFDIDTIKEFFLERVKYLGPLREEPKPVYTTPGSIHSSDVGNKGEFTSFVLELNKNTQIKYISPNSMESQQYEVKEGPLVDAVIEWIKYLDVGHDLQTIDEGSIGRRLKIQLEENGRFVDLTNVGVGVSQVLPILVSSLLAERNSTLIFEQPELHLHPKVQTRLADFFLAIIHLNKQCIIETHSEHIINRLRYRAITSPKDKVPEKTLIYFVEKNQGKSSYRQIRMNEYGNIGKWPKGFFDETESNALSIIKAIQAKKRGQ